MIRIKRSSKLSARTIAEFGPHAKADWKILRSFRGEFYQNLRGLWTLSVGGVPICVLGLRQYTKLGFGGEVILFLCKEFQSHMRQALPFIRRALRRVVKLWGRLCVRVEEGFWIGHKFVKFFGFEPVMYSKDTAGNSFTLYQLRKSWQA